MEKNEIKRDYENKIRENTKTPVKKPVKKRFLGAENPCPKKRKPYFHPVYCETIVEIPICVSETNRDSKVGVTIAEINDQPVD